MYVYSGRQASAPPHTFIDMRTNIIILVSGLVSLGIYFFVPAEESTLKGLAILAFIAILWFTEALPLAVTALLVPILVVAAGVMDVKSALSHFANPVIFLFLGGFALAAALHKHNIDEYIAGYIMNAAGTKPIYAILGLFGATSLISMWISNTATAAIMLPVALGLISKLRTESPATDAFILLGVAYSANIAGLGTLIGSPPNAITAANLGMDFRDWLFVGLPLVVILIPAMVGVLYFVLRPKLPRVEISQIADIEGLVDRGSGYRVGLVFAIVVFLWLFSRPISSWIGIDKEFDSLVAILGIVLLVYFRTIEWKEISRFTDWGVLLLFGGGLVLSAMLSETGASRFLADIVKNHLSVHGAFVLVLGSVMLTILITEFASNTASAAIMVPIFLALGRDTGQSSPEALALAVGIASSMGFMLPVGTPPNALIYGTGLVEQRTMIKAGFVLNIVSGIVITVAAYFFF
ncbi:MAG TPA: DASS family sodium-coupled anion symporter [Thermodesulfobacteriota bacterium]|nr:DASS family sodium-coupled anion symporter [Thermodesulfobacteriota bacterium]